jgi:hypothetical protein
MNEKKEIQMPVHKYLDKLHIKYFTRENNQHQQKYRRTGNQKYKGFPDTIIFIPNGLLLCFEYKTEKGKMSYEQLEWMNYLQAHGYTWFLIRDFEIAKKTIDYYLL